jgi:rSAM/selenodomain-associated transferase 1
VGVALVVFARDPVPGRVKTRLAPVLGDAGAAALHAAFVRDLCERLCGRTAAAGPWDVTVAADPGPDTPFFRELAAALPVTVTAQDDGDLGARMARGLRHALEAGADAALLIGTDLPTLPVGHLRTALEALGGAPLVLGPSVDGGYYLVGARRDALADWDRITARLFAGIPWGTDTVLHDTLGRADGLPVALGPAWYDVDDPPDLERLRRHLESGAGPELPRTRAALAGKGVAA